LKLPESIKGIFTPEFVRRFVFDGEQAEKSMDSSSNEADEAVKYLYRLDELDEILAINQKLLIEIQNAEGNKSSSTSLSNLRTRQNGVKDTIGKLTARGEHLRQKIKKFEDEKKEKEHQRNEIDQNYEQLNQEKNQIIKEQQKNKGDIDVKITEIISMVKSPYLLSEELCNRMCDLGNNMEKLKLPKIISERFFTDLANEDYCVCERCIGEKEKTAILKNAERYLGSEQQSVLNTIKSNLMNCSYDSRLNDAFDELTQLRAHLNRLTTRFTNNEEKLLKTGGEEAVELKTQIEKLIEDISVSKSQLEIIESKDSSDEYLTEENNLNKADLAYKDYEQKIAAATRTNAALHKKEIIDSLIHEIKMQSAAADAGHRRCSE